MTMFASGVVLFALIVSVLVLTNGVWCDSDFVPNNTEIVWVRYGSPVTLDCPTLSDPLAVQWVWNQRQQHIDSKNLSATDPVGSFFINQTDVFQKYSDEVVHLSNGSLFIPVTKRYHAGVYYCIADSGYGNDTFVFVLRLDYDVLSIATLNSMLIGLTSASAFFLIAVFIGLARYLAFVCSSKEKHKRKSIRAVLESIQEYRSAQFDRFSAYRTAKMDQLWAFKSATMGHLSAFRDARVDQLRTYKQATVTSILAHLDRMRLHYAAQTARIKDNCAQQAERLRDSYTTRRGRFRNYRSHQVDRVRENYQAQAARIREYGMMQMSRLRDQYKMQQQHVLKLVELLDVGSCVTGVIEAECMRAESMIFDADIAFDFEAQPVRAMELGNDLDEGDDCGSAGSDLSNYLTACDSENASVNDNTIDLSESVLDVCPTDLENDITVFNEHLLDNLDLDLAEIDEVRMNLEKCLASLRSGNGKFHLSPTNSGRSAWSNSQYTEQSPMASDGDRSNKSLGNTPVSESRNYSFGSSASGGSAHCSKNTP